MRRPPFSSIFVTEVPPPMEPWTPNEPRDAAETARSKSTFVSAFAARLPEFSGGSIATTVSCAAAAGAGATTRVKTSRMGSPSSL